MTDAHYTPLLLRSEHAYLRPTTARRPQPDALRRFDRREWLTLLIRRIDAVASVYRLAASMSPGIDGLRSRVEFHRRGRFDAAIITLDDSG